MFQGGGKMSLATFKMLKGQLIKIMESTHLRDVKHKL